MSLYTACLQATAMHSLSQLHVQPSTLLRHLSNCRHSLLQKVKSFYGLNKRSAKALAVSEETKLKALQAASSKLNSSDTGSPNRLQQTDELSAAQQLPQHERVSVKLEFADIFAEMGLGAAGQRQDLPGWMSWEKVFPYLYACPSCPISHPILRCYVHCRLCCGCVHCHCFCLPCFTLSIWMLSCDAQFIWSPWMRRIAVHAYASK